MYSLQRRQIIQTIKTENQKSTGKVYKVKDTQHEALNNQRSKKINGN